MNPTMASEENECAVASYRPAQPEDRPVGAAVDVMVRHAKLGLIKVEFSPSGISSSFTVTGVLKMLEVLPFMLEYRVVEWGHSSAASGKLSLSSQGASADEVVAVPGDIMEVWVEMAAAGDLPKT
jgi:hypothetical protein